MDCRQISRGRCMKSEPLKKKTQTEETAPFFIEPKRQRAFSVNYLSSTLPLITYSPVLKETDGVIYSFPGTGGGSKNQKAGLFTSIMWYGQSCWWNILGFYIAKLLEEKKILQNRVKPLNYTRELVLFPLSAIPFPWISICLKSCRIDMTETIR